MKNPTIITLVYPSGRQEQNYFDSATSAKCKEFMRKANVMLSNGHIKNIMHGAAK